MLQAWITTSLAATVGAYCLVACGGSAAPRLAVASGEIGCQKVHAGVVESLRSQPDGARARVVVELSNAPRVRDLLQSGVADCVASPSTGAGGTLAGGLSWGEREMSQPTSLPVTCFAWVSLPQVAAWCADPSVRSVDVWE